jgi:hypothetical protein
MYEIDYYAFAAVDMRSTQGKLEDTAEEFRPSPDRREDRPQEDQTSSKKQHGRFIL